MKLDTPGGLLKSTRDIVESILTSDIPVAVYVSPPGSQAASAGAFITAAANFAVMSPGTNIGAASPISTSNKDLSETLEKKIQEDTKAFIRSIASVRGRNSQALEETVTIARSFSAREAVDLDVVDVMASDITALLRQLDGKTAHTASGSVVLRTKNAAVQEINMTLLEKFLGFVANPNLVYILLIVGGLGLLAEFLTPGWLGPGVIGALALILAFVGMGQMSVNWIGAGLIIFAIILLFLEAQASGVGVFGIGAITCFLLGSFLIFGGYFDTVDISEPGTSVSPWLIGGAVSSLGAVLAIFFYILAPIGSSTGNYSGSRRVPPEGQLAKVTSDLHPNGKVCIGQVEWDATTDLRTAIRKGETVRILEVYGRLLKVAREEEVVRVERWSGKGKIFRKRIL